MKAISKPSLWLYNITDDKSILKSNVDKEWCVASLAKLMSAMVIIDNTNDFSELVNMDTTPIMYLRDLAGWPLEERPMAYVNGVFCHDGNYNAVKPIPFVIPTGTYTKDELLKATLSPGDNYATETLSLACKTPDENCIVTMNKKAQALGMNKTNFTSSHGCTGDDVSTIEDMHLMSLETLKYEKLKECSTLRRFLYKGMELENLNLHLMELFEKANTKIIVVKTGFSEVGGLHILVIFEYKDKLYNVIVLGAHDWQNRKNIVKKLLYSFVTR